ncbi:MAG TPA: SigE family RNA polymerase sigma factor [Actinomycetota bacterium]|nr:SigE family RNA polymerase sigma factor [Actinomycetota bacterium]
MNGKTSTVERTGVEHERGGMAELYVRYVPAGIRLAYLLTGDEQQAQDLAHDAFVRCVGRFADLRSREAFDAYLRRAIVNLHTSGIRRRYVERAWLRGEGVRVAAATVAMPDIVGREALWSALGTLPARQRAALVLRYYEDLSERDTAAVLGCSLAAVKSLVARGGDALRATLTEGDER